MPADSSGCSLPSSPSWALESSAELTQWPPLAPGSTGLPRTGVPTCLMSWQQTWQHSISAVGKEQGIPVPHVSAGNKPVLGPARPPPLPPESHRTVLPPECSLHLSNFVFNNSTLFPRPFFFFLNLYSLNCGSCASVRIVAA